MLRKKFNQDCKKLRNNISKPYTFVDINFSYSTAKLLKFLYTYFLSFYVDIITKL